jgi:AraC-like DNA-binding protein
VHRAAQEYWRLSPHKTGDRTEYRVEIGHAEEPILTNQTGPIQSGCRGRSCEPEGPGRPVDAHLSSAVRRRSGRSPSSWRTAATYAGVGASSRRVAEHRGGPRSRCRVRRLQPVSPSSSRSLPCATWRGGACSSRLSWLRKDDTVAILANRLGYESEAAFSRSFKRFIGMSPGAARRNRDARGRRPAIETFTHWSPTQKRFGSSASEPDASLERLILCSPI